MFRVCGLRLGTNFGAWPAADKNFYLRLTVEKIRTIAVFTENVYGHAALVALILRLRLTVNIQKIGKT